MRALVLVLVVAHAAAGIAADRSIGAVKLELKRTSSGKEKLTFTSKDVNFLFPALGGPDDPSTGGATITLVSPVEAPVSFPVPAGVGNPGWRVSDRTLDSYTYRNGGAPAGPSIVRSMSLREGRGIKLVGRSLGLSLSGVQGSVGIRITTGGSRRCAFFGPQSIVIDQANRFLGRGALATGTDCSDEWLGGTSSGSTTTSTTPPACGNGVIDTGEQCDGTTFGPAAPPSGVQCIAAGSPNECHICAQTDQFSCKFFSATYPCCDPAATCVDISEFVGDCRLPTTTSTSSSTTTSTTLFPGCGNGAVGPGEECDGSADTCGGVGGPYYGCFPPGSAYECTCCGNQQCYEGGAGGLLHCCPGLTCAYYPPFTGGVSFGLGECVSECAPAGTSCQVGLPCCPGLVCGPVPGVPPSFPYAYYCQ
jgi:hypothetical protein